MSIRLTCTLNTAPRRRTYSAGITRLDCWVCSLLSKVEDFSRCYWLCCVFPSLPEELVPCYQCSVLSVSPSGSIRFPFAAVATTFLQTCSVQRINDLRRISNFQLVANLSSQDGYPTRLFASFNSCFRLQRQPRFRSLGHSIKHEPLLQSATSNGNTQLES